MRKTNGVYGCGGAGHSEACELVLFRDCPEGRKEEESCTHRELRGTPVWINNLYLFPTEWLNAVERGLLPALRPGELPVNHCGSVGGNCC